MDMESIWEGEQVRSIIRKHGAISILLGQSAIYAVVYLVFGRAGVHVCAIALLVCLALALVIDMEKMSASSRKESAE